MRGVVFQDDGHVGSIARIVEADADDLVQMSEDVFAALRQGVALLLGAVPPQGDGLENRVHEDQDRTGDQNAGDGADPGKRFFAVTV